MAYKRKSPIPIGEGGTNATSLSVSFGAVLFDGSKLATVASVGSSGSVLTSNGVGVAPTFQAPAAGTFIWSVITADQTAAVNNGYICNKASTLALALPATSAAGDIIEVTGMNTALGWQVTQGAGQQIFFGVTQTTLGASGSLASSATRDSVKLLCIVANTSWQCVTGSIGDITIV